MVKGSEGYDNLLFTYATLNSKSTQANIVSSNTKIKHVNRQNRTLTDKTGT